MNSKVTITLLTLLVLYLASAQEESLQCQCMKTWTNFIHPKFIDEINIFPNGPHCPQTAIIATLKSSEKVCLNPDAAWVRKIINRIIEESKKPDADQSEEA
uniref:Interleukin-8 n=1 Tax=Chimaera phantasma TaxID=134990 RepID=Q8AXP4_9CHON|nr:interleukin-8 [Chimaera phantasma]